MSDLRPHFWEDVPLEDLSRAEWEALCDGCGKCCLNKLEYEDGEVELTRISCKLLDGATCRCSKYPIRHQFVPECIVLTPETIENHLYWLPQTCAYRLRYEGKPLYDWHHLISKDANAVHTAGVSMQDRTLNEELVPEDDWDDYVIEEPT
ncbi:MAG: YcgN family cysteine cluster protein [Loktanella sp.]|nr:YcgN family cysteine cluster protein [Loktanella sp.]